MENTSQPKYSVIICAYNVEKYLRKCLDSVLAQDSPSSYEILLIDNGSTDSTGAICDEYAAKYDCIRLTRVEKNAGGVPATCTVLPTARGTYILFLDSDDLWKPDLLTTLDPLTEDLPDMIVFQRESFLDESPLERTKMPAFELPKVESGREWMDRHSSWERLFPFTNWAYGWNRAFVERHQLYPDDSFLRVSDCEMVARGLTVAERIRGTDRVLYSYRIRKNSVSNHSSPGTILAFLKDWATIYSRYHYPFAADCYCMVAIQVAHLGGRREAEESIRFIKEHRDILKDVRHPHSKVARLLFRTFGIYNGARVYVAAHRVKSGIGRKKAAF